MMFADTFAIFADGYFDFADINFNFADVSDVFPWIPGKPPLQRPDGSAIDFDFYNLDDYKKHKLGIYHPFSGCTITPEFERFHRRMLERCGKLGY